MAPVISHELAASHEPSERNDIPIALVVFAFFFFTFLGCSSQLGPERLPVVPVQGVVKLGGKPLAGALVVLHPQPGADVQAIPARGHTNTDGNFQVSTYDANDGAPAGEYLVTVTYHPLVKRGGGYEPGPNVLPKKYADPASTDLVIRVSAANSTIPPLELQRR